MGSTRRNEHTLTPEQFILKWKAAELKELGAAQEHFIDPCWMLGKATAIRHVGGQPHLE